VQSLIFFKVPHFVETYAQTDAGRFEAILTHRIGQCRVASGECGVSLLHWELADDDG
jgi:hypothetical protein